jgi:hypothetical protein
VPAANHNIKIIKDVLEKMHNQATQPEEGK